MNTNIEAVIELDELVIKACDYKAQADYSSYNSPERFEAQGMCNHVEGFAKGLMYGNIITIQRYNEIHELIWYGSLMEK